MKCSDILTKQEEIILYKRFNKRRTSSGIISINQIGIWIAKLGGYIARKSDPPPGIITLWRGWTRLIAMIEDYEVICR